MSFWNVLGPALFAGGGAYLGNRLSNGRDWGAALGGFAGALGGGLLFNNHRRDYSPHPTYGHHDSYPQYYGYGSHPWSYSTSHAQAYAHANTGSHHGYYSHNPFGFSCGC
jgi:hypothetical protein